MITCVQSRPTTESHLRIADSYWVMFIFVAAGCLYFWSSVFLHDLLCGLFLKLSLLYRSSLVDEVVKSDWSISIGRHCSMNSLNLSCLKLLLSVVGWFRILWLCCIVSDPATSCSVGLRWHVFVEVIDPKLWSECSISMELSRNPPLIDQKYTYTFFCCSYLVGLLLALFDVVSCISLCCCTVYKS